MVEGGHRKIVNKIFSFVLLKGIGCMAQKCMSF